ncbi:MAG TPA: TIGR04255 family protein [Acetobacteraceae bacterium]|jgi:uncharacterized protein (TIGR04255 family)
MGEWTFPGPNPITSYTVGLLLERPLPAAVIRQISGQHAHFKRELPRRTEQQAITFQVGASPGQQPRPELGGVTFDYLKPDGGTRAALAVNQVAITYMVAEYTRWAEFWPVAERLLTVVANIALSEVPIRGFLLLANNRFLWSPGEVEVTALIRRDPTYVAPHILECHAQGHSIHGYTIDLNDPAGVRTDNIFCLLGTTDEGPFLDLNFNLQLRLGTVVTTGKALLESVEGRSRPLLEETLDMLHNTNKSLLREIVLESVVSKIPGLPLPC